MKKVVKIIGVFVLTVGLAFASPAVMAQETTTTETRTVDADDDDDDEGKWGLLGLVGLLGLLGLKRRDDDRAPRATATVNRP